MSFSSEVKAEVSEKYFTTLKRHSRMVGNGQKRPARGRGDASDPQELIIDSFLHSGTISDPERFYHLEFVCDTEAEAEKLKSAMSSFDIVPGIMERKEHFVVYLKDSSSLSDLLVIMGATNALLKLEDIMILKEMKETVQRRVNCETANIKKTVSASVRQLEDIQLIRDEVGFSGLSEGLRELAELRTEYPDATLNELAAMMPGTGKSGINHRFRKIAKIADEIRNGNY